MIVGSLPDGRLQVFVVGNDGRAYTKWKLTKDPHSAWSNWLNMGNGGSSFT